MCLVKSSPKRCLPLTRLDVVGIRYGAEVHHVGTVEEASMVEEPPGRARTLSPEPVTLLARRRQQREARSSARILRRAEAGMRRCGGSLAVFALVAAVILPSVGTFAQVSKLWTRNVHAVVGRWSSADFHTYSANDALLRTYQDFHLVDGYYLDRTDGLSGFATAWHQFQLMNMLEIAQTLDTVQGVDPGAALTEAIDAMDSYWNDSPRGYPAGYDATKNIRLGNPDRYVDDNLWLAQALTRQYARTGNEAYMLRARQILDLFVSERDVADGAAWWKVQFPTESNRDKCVVSNATAIPALVDVYLAGYGDEGFLDIAEQVFGWVQQLRDPETGLYFDKIRGNGEIDTTLYTYVQAEVLHSLVRLNAVDAERFPLADAVAFARLTMDHFATRGGYGISKFDAIYLRTLIGLAGQVGDDALTASVQQAIELAKGVIPSSPTELPDAAASAAIIALSEMPVDRWADLA